MAAAKRKIPGTGVSLWQEEMAKAAKQQATSEVVTGNFRSISTRSGILSVDDTPLKDNELRCVVLMSVHENQYYTERFSADTVQIPACYAFGVPDGSGDNMAPHEEATDKQHPQCEGCWANEMGSADTGRGKACKNIRRLALVTEDAMESGAALDEAEVRMLKVPVTSVKGWAKLVHRIAEEMERPSWGVVILIKLLPDPKTQFRLTFAFETLVEFDQGLMDALLRKRAELTKSIVVPYTPPTEDTQKKSTRAAVRKSPPRGGRMASKRGGKY